MRYDWTATHQHLALIHMIISVQLGNLDRFRIQSSWKCVPCTLASLHRDHLERRAVPTSCLYIKLLVRCYVVVIVSTRTIVVDRKLGW